MRRVFIVASEAVLLFAVGVIAAYIRFLDEAPNEIVDQRGWIKLLFATVVIQLAFYLFDLYDLPSLLIG